MRAVWLIARRELGATLRSPSGYVIAALILLLDGLAFNVWGLGGSAKKSFDVLSQFLYYTSGFTSMGASILLSMRLVAEEQQTGTINLLLSSPVRDYQIILGKYLGALMFLTMLLLATFYMPLLVLVNGKVSFGHIFSGYLGLILLGAASLAIGTFGSAIARSQIIAVFLSAALMAVLLLLWVAARVADPPLSEVLPYMALHNLHFRSFMNGKIHLRDIVFYLSVCVFFLAAATRMLESRRWR